MSEKRGTAADLAKVKPCLEAIGLDTDWVDCLLRQDIDIYEAEQDDAGGSYSPFWDAITLPAPFFDETSHELKPCDQLPASRLATLLQEMFHAWVDLCWPFDDSMSTEVEEAISSFLDYFWTGLIQAHRNDSLTDEVVRRYLEAAKERWVGQNGGGSVDISEWVDRILEQMKTADLVSAVPKQRVFDGEFAKAKRALDLGKKSKTLAADDKDSAYIEWDARERKVVVNCAAGELEQAVPTAPTPAPLTVGEATQRIRAIKGVPGVGSMSIIVETPRWVRSQPKSWVVVKGCYVALYSQTTFTLKVTIREMVAGGTVVRTKYTFPRIAVTRTARVLLRCCPLGKGS